MRLDAELFEYLCDLSDEHRRSAAKTQCDVHVALAENRVRMGIEAAIGVHKAADAGSPVFFLGQYPWRYP